MSVEAFFALARERHAVYLRRRAGLPWPWTDDPVLREYSFTNVYRELDKTTVWFREHVREPLRERPEVFLATVLFRWFNRIATGEALFCQTDIAIGGVTAFDHYLLNRDPAVLKAAIEQYVGGPPYVTGAYIILGKRGMPKLEGVLSAFHDFATTYAAVYPGADEAGAVGWREVAELSIADQTWSHGDGTRIPASLEATWEWLRGAAYQGDFTAYEVVTDLRHTALLDRAPDVMTWANPGPGACRGADRVLGRSTRRHVVTDQHDYHKVSKAAPEEALALMRELLQASQDRRYWPQETSGDVRGHRSYARQLHREMKAWQPGDWPAWEMREVEHWTCEFDKHQRTVLGEGRPRNKFKLR